MTYNPRFRLADPFIGYVSAQAAVGTKELLLSNRVQEINFDFGSVPVHAHYFREIAKLIVPHLKQKGIHIVVHPTYLIHEKAEAMYVTEADSIYVSSAAVLNDEDGRATIVHECVHAVCDYRGRSTAMRSEEGAALVAEAWYLQSSNDTIVFDEDHYGPVWEIAQRLRDRWLATRQPVPLKASEINAARLRVAQLGTENGYYSNNGIVGG
jgi:hypothetical protein